MDDFDRLFSTQNTQEYYTEFGKVCHDCGKEVSKGWRKTTSTVLMGLAVGYCVCVASAFKQGKDDNLPILNFGSLLKAGNIWAVNTNTSGTLVTSTASAGPTGPSGDMVGISPSFNLPMTYFPMNEKGSPDGIRGPVVPTSFFQNQVNQNGSEVSWIEKNTSYFEVRSDTVVKFFTV